LETDLESLDEVAIRFLNGPLAEQVITLQKQVTTIGRDRQNDIIVLHPKVSRQHARIRWQYGSWIIENLSQGNFISIDQQRTQQGVLWPNNVVNLGADISFVFLKQQQPQPQQQIGATTPAPPPSGANLQARPSSGVDFQARPSTGADFQARPNTGADFQARPSSGVDFQARPTGGIESTKPIPRIPTNVPVNISKSGTVLAPKAPTLTITSNINSGRYVHLLDKAVQNIGRDPENEIVIDDPIVSAKHAQIVREGNKYFLVHPHPSREKTLNGLLHQGIHISGSEKFRKQLMPGDIYRIGDEHGTLISLLFLDETGVTPDYLPEMQPIPLNGTRLSIGRTADNTVILNHPQVSARHAVLERAGNGYQIIDTNSTNHVYVNGEQVVNHKALRTGDEIRIGPYRLVYTGVELKPYDESSHIRIDALRLKKTGNNNIILLNDISLTIPPRKFVALVGGSGAGKSTLMDALNGLRPAQSGQVLYNNVDYYRNLASFNTQLGYVPQDDIVHRELTVERALYYAARLRLPRDFTREQIQWRIDEVLEDVEMTERRYLLVNKLSGGQRKRVSIALELLANPGVFFLDEPTSGLDPGLDRKMMVLLRRLADRGRTIILVTHATNNITVCDYVCFLARGGRLAYFGPPEEAKTFFKKSDFGEIYSTLEPTKEQPDIPRQAEIAFLGSPDYQKYVAGPMSERQQSSTATTTATKPPKRARGGSPLSQFTLLSMRYIELLKNDVGNLLLLLLQAPIIAILLVLLVRFEIGVGVFDANKVVPCVPQIATSQGPIVVKQTSNTTIDCNDVKTFLTNSKNTANPTPGSSEFLAKTLVQNKGGNVDKALQSFIEPGAGADAQKVLFIIAFTAVLFGCINGSREIVKEIAIYSRERAVNLGILPYMFSKVGVLTLLSLVQSVVLVAVLEIGEPLQQGILFSPILETYITVALTSLTGLVIGLTISSLSTNSDRAISFVPFILLPQVFFSGAIIPLKDWTLQVIATIFPSRWAMVALGSSIGVHSDTAGGDQLFGTDPSYHGTLFSIYDKTDAAHRLLISWGALGAILVGLMIVIAIALKSKDVRA
jgi:ABC transport system ATP-binding/permease protein